MSLYFDNSGSVYSYCPPPAAHMPAPTPTQASSTVTSRTNTIGSSFITGTPYCNGKVPIPRLSQETTTKPLLIDRNLLHESIMNDAYMIIKKKIETMTRLRFSLWNTFSTDDPIYPVDYAFKHNKPFIAFKILMANTEISQTVIKAANRFDILFTGTEKITVGMDTFFQDCTPDILSQKSSNGSSLLHKAVYWNNKDVVQTLIDKCPDLLLEKNDDGNTPIQTLLDMLNTHHDQDKYIKFKILLYYINDIKDLLTTNIKGYNVYSQIVEKNASRFLAELNKKLNFLLYNDCNNEETPLHKKIYYYCLFGIENKVNDLLEEEFSLHPELPFSSPPSFFSFLVKNYYQAALGVFSYIINTQETVPLRELLETFHSLEIDQINTIPAPLAKSVMLLSIFGREDKIPSLLDGVDVMEVRKIFTNRTHGLDVLIQFHPYAATVIFNYMLSVTDPKHFSFNFFLHSLQVAIRSNQSSLMFSLLFALPDEPWSDFIKNNPTLAFDLIQYCDDKFIDLCFAKCSLDNIQNLCNDEQNPLLILLIQNQNSLTVQNLLKRIHETDTSFNISPKIQDYLSTYLEETDNHETKELLTQTIATLLLKSLCDYQETAETCSFSSDDFSFNSNPETSSDSSPEKHNLTWGDSPDMSILGSDIELF